MTTKILPKLIAITPCELYFQIVSGTYDAMRFKKINMEYTPAQFGGIFGQKTILDQSTVMEVTTFEVS